MNHNEKAIIILGMLEQLTEKILRQTTEPKVIIKSLKDMLEVYEK